MNKTQLVKTLSENSDMTKTGVERVLNELVNIIATETKAGNDVNITGLGIFKKTTRKARSGRNPKTGETIQIAPRDSLTFKQAKAIKDKFEL